MRRGRTLQKTQLWCFQIDLVDIIMAEGKELVALSLSASIVNSDEIEMQNQEEIPFSSHHYRHGFSLQGIWVSFCPLTCGARYFTFLAAL